jgi:hypothetical protein
MIIGLAVTEQVCSFNHPEYNTSYLKNTDMERKLIKYHHGHGKIRRNLKKNETRMETQAGFYKNTGSLSSDIWIRNLDINNKKMTININVCFEM